MTTLNKTTCQTTSTKILGTKLSASADIKHRIMLANQAFGTQWRLWFDKRHVSLSLKIRLYNSTVKAILLYNMSTIPASDHQLEAIAAAHRRHLRSILQIRHPVHVTNTDLYAQAHNRNIIIDIMEQRIKLLGHILRSGYNTPAYQSMLTYLGNPNCKPVCKGKTPTTLPLLLDRDLQYAHLRLRTYIDLLHVTALAANRSYWTNMTLAIISEKTNQLSTIMNDQKCKRRRHRLASQRITSQREATIEYTDGNQQIKRIRLTAFSPAGREAPLTLRLKRRRIDDQDLEAAAQQRRRLIYDLVF